MQQFEVTNTLDEKEKIQKNLDELEQKTEINKMKFNKKLRRRKNLERHKA